MTDHEPSATALRTALADQVERDFSHLHPSILALLRKVERHRFVPGVDLKTAYVDDAVITRRDPEGRAVSSISQPSMVAQMLDMLDVHAGQRVLEIGAGTGYAAALLADLVGPTGAVTTIDLDPEITDEAAGNLDANGYSRVTVTCGDGALGDPTGAPWDRILVSVGAWEPSPEWINQLAPDGRIVMPLGLQRIQRIVAFEPTAYGLRSVRVLAGGFLAQRGRDAVPRASAQIGEELRIESEHGIDLEPETVTSLFATEPVTMWTEVELPPPGRFDRLLVYLALSRAGMFTLTAPGTYLPGALRAWNIIYGFAENGTVAHLALRASDPDDPQTAHEVGVLAYGSGAADLAESIAADARAWSRMEDADPAFAVYPKTMLTVSAPDGLIMLEKYHSRIHVTWPTEADQGAVEHRMRLLPEYFDLVAAGQKTIEIRCDDRKRRAVQAGSLIRFDCGDRSLTARVLRVARYASFEALYEHEDPAAVNPLRTRDDQLAGVEALYDERKRALGAVALEISVIEAP